MPDFMPLKEIIAFLEKSAGIKICIHDINGVTGGGLLEIGSDSLMHASSFCDAAKSTSQGYERCVSHKNRANIKAISEKKAFSGFCPYGLFEAAAPVVINDRTECVIYAGRIAPNPEAAKKRIENTCRKTGVSKDLMNLELEKVPRGDIEVCMEAAKAVDSIIRLLFEKSGDIKDGRRHWVVMRMMEYADKNFDKNLTLKQMSMLYFMEEKYLGRLFKKQTGKRFSEYVNDKRMKKALELLLNTSEKIIDISDMCGFNNVTYFNRVFKKYYGSSPAERRKGERA